MLFALLLALIPLFEPAPMGTARPLSPGDPGCATQPIFVTSGNAQTNYSTLNNYAGVPTAGLGKQTITTTVSCGPLNEWLVTAQQAMTAVSGTSNQAAYGCIWQFSGPAVTLVDFLTFAGPATICNPAPANTPATAAEIAGGPIFGGSNPSNAVQGGSQVIEGHFLMTNSTTVTIQFAVSTNAGSGSQLVGSSTLRADPI